MSQDAPLESLDLLALELQQLRETAGNPSYAEIAARIARRREARGVPAAAARVGRTTVYDCFRTGRRRVASDLVVEIVTALRVDDAAASAWAARCGRANRSANRSARWTEEPDGPPTVPALALPPAWTVRRVLLVALGCVALNLAGRGVVVLLGLPLHLDMTGTAVAAVILGPWWGAGVGALTNVAGVGISGPDSLAFIVVNVAGALVWGYGVRRFRMAETIPRFFGLSLLVGVVCSALAAPVIVVLMHGVGGNGTDEVMGRILSMSDNLVLAVFAANLLTSLLDKVLSGAVALVALESVRAQTFEDSQ